MRLTSLEKGRDVISFNVSFSLVLGLLASPTCRLYHCAGCEAGGSFQNDCTGKLKCNPVRPAIVARTNESKGARRTRGGLTYYRLYRAFFFPPPGVCVCMCVLGCGAINRTSLSETRSRMSRPPHVLYVVLQAMDLQLRRNTCIDHKSCGREKEEKGKRDDTSHIGYVHR